MGDAAASPCPGGPTITQERATIRINDIPTELLERLLGKYVEQVNESYKKTQGELEIRDLDETNAEKDVEPIEPKKRTLAEVNATFDITRESKDRTLYSDNVLPLYGQFSGDYEIKEILTKTDEPVADVLEASVIQIMEASVRYTHKEEDLYIGKNAASLMTNWAAQFFHILTIRLQRLMEIQRRRLPNRDDLNLLLKEGFFEGHEIEDMVTFSKKYRGENPHKIREIQNLAVRAISSYRGDDDGSFNVTNDSVTAEEAWWIDQIVHRKKRKTYIPEWMPPLPPEHTFKCTPKYSQRITNPVILREKLVEEGRFGEKALDHIIVKEDNTLCSPLSEESIISGYSSTDDDEEKQNDDLQNKPVVGEEMVGQSGKEDNGAPAASASVDIGMSAKNDAKTDINDNISDGVENVENDNAENPATSDKKVDLIALAKKRMAILDKRRKEEEQRYSFRVESDESRFGRNLGFYTSTKKLPDDFSAQLNEFRTKKMKYLIRNLHKQEKHHAKWVIEQEELRKKIDEEKSKYAEANEIQLGAGSGPNDENVFYADIDEEVDFDVEFSDMEEVNDAEDPTKTFDNNASPTEFPELENNQKDEDKVLSVRFQDEIDTSTTSPNGEVEEIEPEREGEERVFEEEEIKVEDISDIDSVAED